MECVTNNGTNDEDINENVKDQYEKDEQKKRYKNGTM